ncbi:MAG: hypothetical protein AAFX93_03755 [Verrucomicrobiota bacterium]
MLREFKGVRQEPGDGYRRWWTGDGMEFIAWFDDADSLTGYQLCYRGCAFTWKTEGDWSHVRVDDDLFSARVDPYGTTWQGRGACSPTPVLRPNGAPSRPPFGLLKLFERASETVKDPLKKTVETTLGQVVRRPDSN